MLEAILNNLVFEWWFSKTYVNVLKPCDTCWLSDGMKTNEKWHTFYADSVMMSCQNIMWQKHKGRSWAERHRQFNQHRSQHSDDNCNITFHRPTHEAISQQGHCVKDLLPATQKAQPFREWTRQARHHWLRSETSEAWVRWLRWQSLTRWTRSTVQITNSEFHTMACSLESKLCQHPMPRRIWCITPNVVRIQPEWPFG